MTQITRPPTMSQSADPEALGLTRVLTDLLPRSLHTPDGPERYTVSAVFTRRPSAGEIAALNGEAARAWLDQEQYPGVTVTVSDRRLEIANTNLEELGAGLAGSIARLLAQITAADTARVHAADDALQGSEQLEEDRWAAVRGLIGEIDLHTPRGSADAAPALGLARVVTSLLPSSLGDDVTPRRYTVVTEFDRPLTHTESEIIAGDLPHQRLTAAGYPGVSVHVRDRRLEVHDTDLSELRDGLADVIAAMLVDIGHEAAAQDAETAAAAARLAEREDERAQYVAAAASAISFDVPGRS